jgi:hypothetical protein
MHIYIIHVGKAFEDGTEPKTMPMKFNGIIHTYIYICMYRERGERERERKREREREKRERETSENYSS